MSYCGFNLHSLVISEVEHLFTYMLHVNCMSSLEKYLSFFWLLKNVYFRSSAHLKKIFFPQTFKKFICL